MNYFLCTALYEGTYSAYDTYSAALYFNVNKELVHLWFDNLELALF
jgi:hypothetical protein